MKRSTLLPAVAGGLALGTLALVLDRGARGEVPKAPPAKTARAADLTKEVVIERPVRRTVARESAAVAASGEFRNPRVRPGRVSWHPDFATACEASRKSGKPVLLFQMLGKLDDRFC